MSFFFKQKTAYEMRISDWRSDVCSSDLYVVGPAVGDERGTALTQAYLTLPAGFRVFQTFVDGVDNAVRVVKTDGDYVHYMITSVLPPGATQETRSEERRGGKEGVSTWSSRGARYH